MDLAGLLDRGRSEDEVEDTHVAIVEFGEKSSRGISEVLQKLRVKHEIVSPEERPRGNVTHIILSGGPSHVYDEDSPKMPVWVYHTDVPVLAICYGMQLVASSFGMCDGDFCVKKRKEKEAGAVVVTEMIDGESVVEERWMNRYDVVVGIPKCFRVTGRTEAGDIAAFTDNVKWFCVQYHPESEERVDYELFRRFLMRGRVER